MSERCDDLALDRNPMLVDLPVNALLRVKVFSAAATPGVGSPLSWNQSRSRPKK